MTDEVEFLPADKQRFFQIDTIILDLCDQTCPNYPEQQTDSMIFDGDGQASPKFPK